MKVRSHCLKCLKTLARTVVALSGGDEGLFRSCLTAIEVDYGPAATPPSISNRLLKLVRARTVVDDPFSRKKETEYEAAKNALRAVATAIPGESLERSLRLSALGNGSDFFVDDTTALTATEFEWDVDKVRRAFYTSGGEALILGDNIGDFLFDLALLNCLKGMGKKVYYAVKEHPVQNDLSMVDVHRFGLDRFCPHIVSTGTDEVGIRTDQMKGKIRDLWEGDALVIAKGMGNYETLSEFDSGRAVVYVMKVKCPSVAEDTGSQKDRHIAMIRGG